MKFLLMIAAVAAIAFEVPASAQSAGSSSTQNGSATAGAAAPGERSAEDGATTPAMPHGNTDSSTGRSRGASRPSNGSPSDTSPGGSSTTTNSRSGEAPTPDR